MELDDCMIDLETLATSPDAFILAIAAVMFNAETGVVGPQMYYRIHVAGDQYGAKIDAGTVQWWMNQSQAARDELFAYGQERVRFETALAQLRLFLEHHQPRTLWQRGNIDSIWLERAYKRCGEEPPFHFGQWADQRTATRGHAKVPRKALVAHNALDDCLQQITDLIAATTKNKPE